MFLRQSTARVVSFGPFVDPTDGKTLVTSLVSALDHASTGIKLSKNGGALTIRHATVTASTYDGYGNYRVTLDTTDTNTLGHLRMQFTDATTNLPVWMDFEVLTATAWDAHMASSGGYLPADVQRWLGTATLSAAGGYPDVNMVRVNSQTTSAAAGVTFPSSIASPTNITGGTIGLVNILTTYTGNTPQTGDSYAILNGGALSLASLTVSGATVFTGNVGMAAGLTITQSTTNGHGLSVTGNGSGAGFRIISGSTTGDGLKITTTGGDGISVIPVSGNAMVLTGAGASKHGLVVTGGSAGTSDGIKAVAGTGGVPIRGNITGNITGTIDTATNLTNNTPTGGTITAGTLNLVNTTSVLTTNVPTSGTITLTTTTTNLTNAPTAVATMASDFANMITGTGTAGAAFDTAALANAPGGTNTTTVNFLPAAATVSTGEVDGTSLVAYQNQTITFAFGVVDSNGAAINLTGKVVAFYASKPSTQNTPVITQTTTGGGVVISGTSHNTASVTLDDDDTEDIARYVYSLWNVTDDYPLARGILEVKAIPQAVP